MDGKERIQQITYLGEDALRRLHAAAIVAAIDHAQRRIESCGIEVDLAHGTLEGERRLVDVLGALQVAAVVALAHGGELALSERKGHVEEQRQIGPRQGVVSELEIEDPTGQPAALVARGQLGALVTDVGIDIAVEQHGLAVGDPLPDLGRGLGPVAGKEQGDEVGIDPVGAAELAAQKTGDELAVDRSVETRKMEIGALDAALREPLAQQTDLRRFAGTVQAFEYDEHRGFFVYGIRSATCARPAASPRPGRRPRRRCCRGPARRGTCP